MSEPKIISPLLDDYALGAPLSEREGVCCCPALHKEDEKRYIVKIVSFPSSQIHFDALLLTRAYRTVTDAISYFKRQADALAEEAAFLQSLSELEGFMRYDAWQVIPMASRDAGFDVYLLGEYRRSLEKHMRRHPITYLEAMNLGIDLCTALSVCRRAGRIFVNLKPSNIFLSPKGDFRISDLGFVKTDDLKYASMPKRCVSPYAPPEAQGPMSVLDVTADTYALGRILMQIYNGGILPPVPEKEGEPLPRPKFADDELTALLQKACALEPARRWQDPAEMGHALVRYMQRNTVNDTPIRPDAPVPDKPDDTADFHVPPAKPAEDPRTAQVWELAPEPTEDENPESLEDTVPEPREEPAPASEPKVNAEEDGQTLDAPPVAVPAQDKADAPAAPEDPAELAEPLGADEPAAAGEATEPEAELSESSDADAVPDGETAGETPESIHPLIIDDTSKEDSPDDAFSKVLESVSALLGSSPKPTYQAGQTGVTVPKVVKKAKSKKRSGNARIVLATLLVLFLFAAAIFGGVSFYRGYYLLSVEEISVDGSQNAISVTVKTDADPELLTVICSDSYGNQQSAALTDDGVRFTELTPGTMYKISLETGGFHKLVGQVSEVYTTPKVTNVVEIAAVTGSEDGSVVLTLTVDGTEPDGWTVTCFADGQASLTQDFSGHAVTLYGLTVGQTYTLQLGTVDGSSLVGNTSVEFTAANVVKARELTVTAHSGTELTVTWETPSDVNVEQWSVRCYGTDYDETLLVAENTATFTGLNAETAYTVEVTADQMTQPARLSVTANPINITGYHVVQDDTDNALTISWDYDGNAPESGWLLMYSIDGNPTQNVEKCESASATISSVIPGASYRFTVASPDSVSIFNCDYDYTVPQADVYTGHAISAYRISGQTLVTPSDANWSQSTVTGYTSAFTVGQSISVVLHAGVNFYLDEEDLTILYVIRDESGSVVSSLTAEEAAEWNSLWSGGDYHYAELDVPNVPNTAGSYTLDIYFNGKSVVSLPFTME